MFKKVFASTLAMLLLVASMGFAANMQVNSSASPVSGGTISPSGIKFYNGVAATYTATPKAGWSLANVKIDGVVATAPYTVPFDTSKIHTVVASFTQALYSITTTTTAGGTVTVTGGGSTNITPGSTRGYVVGPNTGYLIATLTVDGTPVVPADPTVAYTDSFTNIQANHTVDATFALNPVGNTVVTAGSSQTVAPTSTTLTGSASSNINPIVYQWNLVSGPSAATFGTPNAASTTINGLVLGTYKVTLTANTVVSPEVTITVVNPGVVNPLSVQCITCHAGSAQVVAYSTSVHAVNNASCSGCHTHGTPKTCSSCHATGTNNAQAFLPTCQLCHGGDVHAFQAGAGQIGCTPCHGFNGDTAHITMDANGCIGCHSVAAPAHPGNVNDNNGVRAITQEFNKWSHHVTGVTLNNAHCAACHLEGTVVDGQVVVDSTKHMADAKTHLRNADTDADMQWDPAAPSFSTMDNFCLSCHDSNGATSAISQAVQSYINNNNINAAGKTASASNPFGDTISNQYDLLERPAVVDAAGQFATGNPSHHAVLGKRYTGNSRKSSGTNVRTIADVAGFTNNSSANLPGARTTIFDAGKFEASYTTLADASGETGARNGGSALGDDSTLHCGDCHTVGQYKAADVGTRYNNAVIGAHGSNNEYLLRNNAGTDAKHTGVKFAGTGAFGAVLGYNTTTRQLDGTQAYLVCFNCHAFTAYGSTYGVSGSGHAAEYDQGSRCNGPYNTTFNNMTGEARLRSVKTNNNGTLPVADGTNTFGNVFGIQCNNCHNSGVGGNMFGGIHGAKEQTYTDGMGNTSKHFRFLPGLGNTMFVPGVKGGFTGGSLVAYNSYSGNRDGSGTGNATGQTYTTLPVRTIIDNVTVKTGSYQYVTGGVSSDLNWEQKSQQPIAGQVDLQSKSMGCYTLSPPGTVKVVGQNGDANKLAATDGQLGPDGRELFDVWGGCDDHNGAQGAGTGPTRKVLRKVDY